MSDEIQARMSINTDPWTKALNKSRGELAEWSEHTRAHMDRTATSARSIHRVLEDIGKISPLLGVGLSAAFSLPLAGLELFKLGLDKIKEHYAEIKKAAKESAEAEARLRELRHDGVFEQYDQTREIKKELQDRERSGEMSPGSKERLEAEEDFKNQISEKEEALKQAKDAQKKKLEERPGDADGIRRWRQEIEIADKAVLNLNIELDQLKQKKFDVTEADKDAQKEFKKSIEDKKKAAEEEERIDKEDEQRKRNLRALMRQQRQEEKAAVIESIQEQSLRDRIAEHFMAPFRPSMGELSQSGGQNGALASRILHLQQLGKQANMAGRKDLLESVKRELYGYDSDPDASRAAGGVAQRDINGNTLPMSVHHAGLMDRMRDKNILAPDQALQSMQQSLQMLLERATSSGIIIDTAEK